MDLFLTQPLSNHTPHQRRASSDSLILAAVSSQIQIIPCQVLGKAVMASARAACPANSSAASRKLHRSQTPLDATGP